MNDPLTSEQRSEDLQDLEDGEFLIVAMYDGSTRRIDSSLDVEVFEALLTPTGGEVVDF